MTASGTMRGAGARGRLMGSYRRAGPPSSGCTAAAFGDGDAVALADADGDGEGDGLLCFFFGGLKVSGRSKYGDAGG